MARIMLFILTLSFRILLTSSTSTPIPFGRNPIINQEFAGFLDSINPGTESYPYSYIWNMPADDLVPLQPIQNQADYPLNPDTAINPSFTNAAAAQTMIIPESHTQSHEINTIQQNYHDQHIPESTWNNWDKTQTYSQHDSPTDTAYSDPSQHSYNSMHEQEYSSQKSQQGPLYYNENSDVMQPVQDFPSSMPVTENNWNEQQTYSQQQQQLPPFNSILNPYQQIFNQQQSSMDHSQNIPYQNVYGETDFNPMQQTSDQSYQQESSIHHSQNIPYQIQQTSGQSYQQESSMHHSQNIPYQNVYSETDFNPMQQTSGQSYQQESSIHHSQNIPYQMQQTSDQSYQQESSIHHSQNIPYQIQQTSDPSYQQEFSVDHSQNIPYDTDVHMFDEVLPQQSSSILIPSSEWSGHQTYSQEQQFPTNPGTSDSIQQTFSHVHQQESPLHQSQNIPYQSDDSSMQIVQPLFSAMTVEESSENTLGGQQIYSHELSADNTLNPTSSGHDVMEDEEQLLESPQNSYDSEIDDKMESYAQSSSDINIVDPVSSIYYMVLNSEPNNLWSWHQEDSDQINYNVTSVQLLQQRYVFQDTETPTLSYEIIPAENLSSTNNAIESVQVETVHEQQNINEVNRAQNTVQKNTETAAITQLPPIIYGPTTRSYNQRSTELLSDDLVYCQFCKLNLTEEEFDANHIKMFHKKP